MEPLLNITFLFKLGKTPTETYEMSQTLCGDKDLKHFNVFEWFKWFKDGRKDLQDDSKCRHNRKWP
jgi:hypothetical protein